LNNLFNTSASCSLNQSLCPSHFVKIIYLLVDFLQSFEDPFGDGPFKAFTSTETAPSQPVTYQSIEPSQSNARNVETNFGFGDSFSVVPYTAPASDTQPFSTNSQFLSQDVSSAQLETDILADILPPAPLPEISSQQNISAPGFGHSSLPSLPASSGQMASQPFSEPTGQFTPKGFSAATSQPAQTFPVPTDQFSQQPFSAPSSQPGPVPSFSSPSSQYAQQPFSSHTGQHAFSTSTGQHIQPPFASQVGQPAQSGGIYGGLHSQDGSSNSQNGYNGHMNSGNFMPTGSTAAFPSNVTPQTPTGQLSAVTNFSHPGGSAPNMSQSPTNQASQFNNNFIGQQGNAGPFSSPITNQSLASNASQSIPLVSQPSKDKFETKSTVWADTLSRGLVNLNISGRECLDLPPQTPLLTFQFPHILVRMLILYGIYIVN